MIIAAESIQAFLDVHHPVVGKEVRDKLQHIPCTEELSQAVVASSQRIVSDKWQAQLIAISSLLLLCSPETIHTSRGVRRSSGVATLAAKALGISQQCVSRKIERAVHYYTHIGWCRDAVDSIVKEVRDGREEK